ncbi:MAG: MmgE/PrpD family protein [Rhodobacteraceae bacterium]|nr:MmgE/PrpD family protein [Paracoccaceae bacterium]
MTGAERIAAFALGDWTLPGDVAGAAALHFMDAIGVGLAASAGTEQGGWQRAVQGPGRATCLTGGLASPAEAAMLNGALIHSLEYDDTHIGSVIHGSAVALPAALAAAEAAGASGADCLAGYAVAWEVMIRIGLAAPGAFQARGVQATSIAGAIGAAAAAGRIMGLDRAGLVAAIGIAGSQASGLLAFLEDGSSVKALNPGWAAQTGLRAAALSSAGMVGPAGVLESPFGVMKCFAGDTGSLAEMLDDLGAHWRLPEAAFKLYPVCHYIHPFLEALERLMSEGLEVENLGSLTLHVAQQQAPLICEPWDRRQAPLSGYDGKWGLAYCLALRLVGGAVDIASFKAAPRDEVITVARRMSWVPVENSGFPNVFPARIDVETRDGRRLSAKVDTVRGVPGRPIDAAEIEAKLRANAARALPPGITEKLVSCLAVLAELPDLSAVAELIRR